MIYVSGGTLLILFILVILKEIWLSEASGRSNWRLSMRTKMNDNVQGVIGLDARSGLTMCIV